MVKEPNSKPLPKRWADDVAPMRPEAESVVVGSMILCDEKTYAEMRPLLGAEMFANEDYRGIFEVIADVRDNGGKMDGFIAYTELDRRGVLNECGGTDLLSEVINTVPNPGAGPQYAAYVVETYKLRELDAIASKIRDQVRLPVHARESATSLVETLQNALAGMLERSSAQDIQTLGEVVRATIEEMKQGGAPRVPSGVEEIDREIGGFAQGEMTLIAARPSMGKSLLGKQIADNMAQARIPVGYVTLEESSFKLGRNWLARNAKIANYRVRKGELTRDEWTVAGEWGQFSGGLPYYVSEKAMTLSAVCSVIRLMHARFRIKAAFVDYLQLVESGKTEKNREQEVAKISRRLKNLFKRLGIAGVVMAQLNRGNETGGRIRPPRLSDLRESGQLEQDADVVLMIHRPDYYTRGEGEVTNKVQVIVAKYRDSGRGEDLELMSDLEHQEFVSPEIVDVFR